MSDVELPDLSRLRNLQGKPKELPPQTSAEDTSNWDDRAFSAPNLEATRKIIFDIPPDEVGGILPNPLVEQEKNKAAIRAKKKNVH